MSDDEVLAETTGVSVGVALVLSNCIWCRLVRLLCDRTDTTDGPER